jgi:hypothetical protein
MNSTLEQIQALSEERSALYRLAGKQHLTPDQQARLNSISGQLPGLWDTYRRELVAARRLNNKSTSPYDVDAA